MSTINSRWTIKLHIRQSLVVTARARFKLHKTKANHDLVLKRLAQVAAAERVLKRHPATPTSVSEAGVKFIADFEGFSATQYNDGVGVMTIGYGTTSADVHPLPKRVTKAQAETLLRTKLDKKYLPPVLKAIGPMHPNQNMIDAAVSFAYNLGEGAFEGVHGFETLTRALHARDRTAVAKAFLLYDDPGQPAVHEGLKRRRQAESKLWLKGARS